MKRKWRVLKQAIAGIMLSLLACQTLYPGLAYRVASAQEKTTKAIELIDINGSTTFYDTLEEGVAAATLEEGSTLKLQEDVIVTSQITVDLASCDFTFDLNGNTINYEPTSVDMSKLYLLLVYNGKIVITDSTGAGGYIGTLGFVYVDEDATVCVENISINLVSGVINMMQSAISNSGTLSVTDVEIDTTRALNIENYGSAIVKNVVLTTTGAISIENFGEIEIYETEIMDSYYGIINCAKMSIYSGIYTSERVVIYNYQTAELHISGGTFESSKMNALLCYSMSTLYLSGTPEFITYDQPEIQANNTKMIYGNNGVSGEDKEYYVGNPIQIQIPLSTITTTTIVTGMKQGMFYYIEEDTNYYAKEEAIEDAYNLSRAKKNICNVVLYKNGSIVEDVQISLVQEKITRYELEYDGSYSALVKDGVYEIYVDGRSTGETVTVDGATVSKKVYGYTISYDANASDAEGEVPSDETIYFQNETVTIKEEVLTRANYRFAGWSTTKDGKPMTSFVMSGADSQKLYAVWRGTAELVASDFTMEDQVIYNGAAQDAKVSVVDGVEGVGEITVYYKEINATDDSRTTKQPKYAGTYEVSVDVEEGSEYTSTTKLIVGIFTIQKKQLQATYEAESIIEGTQPEYKITVTGFENGENEQTARLYKAPVIANTNSLSKGEYELTPTLGSAADYEFVYISGVLSITEKKVQTPTMELNIAEDAPSLVVNHSEEELASLVFTEGELAQITSGENGTMTFVIESIKDKENQPEIDGYISDLYLDITLTATVGEQKRNVTNTSGLINMTIAVPEQLQTTSYQIIRIHNGEVSVLEDLDESEEYVTFETDRFSTYILAHQAVFVTEEPKVTASPSPEVVTQTEKPSSVESMAPQSAQEPTERPAEESKSESSVKTGDNNYLLIGWILVVSALATFIGYCLYKVMKRYEK